MFPGLIILQKVAVSRTESKIELPQSPGSAESLASICCSNTVTDSCWVLVSLISTNSSFGHTLFKSTSKCTAPVNWTFERQDKSSCPRHLQLWWHNGRKGLRLLSVGDICCHVYWLHPVLFQQENILICDAFNHGGDRPG